MSGDTSKPVVTPTSELLARMSASVKQTVAPNTTGPAKSQAFMVAVVLQKVAKQIALEPQHTEAAQRDHEALCADLDREHASGFPARTEAAAREVNAVGDAASLCGLVSALYADRSALGDERFHRILGLVRRVLRADVDRRMEYSA